MKILVVGNDYKQQFPLLDYGGIESCVENLCIGLYEHFKDIEVKVVVPKILNCEEYIFDFDIWETQFIESSKSGLHTSEFIRDVKNVLSKTGYKPDIIWAQSHWSALYLQDLGIPIISTIHDSGGWADNKFIYHPNVYYRFVSEYLYNHVFENPTNRDDINKIKSKSFYCHTGLIDSEYDFEPNKHNYILWVGGLHWGMDAKGLNMVIELSKILPHENFMIYGTGNDEIANHLIKTSKEIPNFNFMGKLNRGINHNEVFKRAKLFTMFSKIPEAFGRTGLEAISKGTPVIGTMYGSIPEQVNHPNVGKCSNDINELTTIIETTSFDYSECYKFSRDKYHIKTEIENLLKVTYKILGGDHQ